MEIKTKKMKSMMVFYFGKPENTTLSIIVTNPQIQFTCEVGNKPVNAFMTLWDDSMDVDFYLNSEMEQVTEGINTGIKCLPHAGEYLKKQYMQLYNKFKEQTDPNMKKLTLKSLANIKAAINLMKWFKEHKDEYDFTSL